MQGLDKFKEYMSGFRSHYVVIGGMATVMTLKEKGYQPALQKMWI